MTLAHRTSQDAVSIRRFDYDDRTVLAVDLGPGAEPTIDLVDGTAIVVYGDDEQAEIDLPEGEVQAFNRNGVVRIEVRE